MRRNGGTFSDATVRRILRIAGKFHAREEMSDNGRT